MIYEFNASKFFSCVEFASVIQFLVNNQTTNDQSPIMIRNDENTTKCDAFSIELTTIVSESEWVLFSCHKYLKRHQNKSHTIKNTRDLQK